MPVRPILLHGPSFLSTVLKTFGQLARIFWANGLPPLLAKNCPYAYDDRVWSGRRTDSCSILLNYIPHLRTTLRSYHGNILISVGKVWIPVSTPIWRRSMISFSKYKRTFLVAEYSFNLTAKESCYIHPRQQR